MSGSDHRRGVAAQAWLLRSRELLQRSADDLDGETRSRLSRARHAALDRLDRFAYSPRWMTRVGLASLALGVGLILWRSLVSTVSTAPPPAADPPIATAAARPAIDAPAPRSKPIVISAEAALVSEPDFELLAEADSLDLLDALEFYAWLQQDADGDG